MLAAEVPDGVKSGEDGVRSHTTLIRASPAERQTQTIDLLKNLATIVIAFLHQFFIES